MGGRDMTTRGKDGRQRIIRSVEGRQLHFRGDLDRGERKQRSERLERKRAKERREKE